MTVVSANITTELLAHTDGRPIAYVDATAVAVFAYQQPDGTYVIEVCIRDDIPEEGLRLLLDGSPLMQLSTEKALI
jgi:hypothetical protein